MFLMISNKIAQAENIALACRLLILLGGRNHQKSENIQKSYLLKQKTQTFGEGFAKSLKTRRAKLQKTSGFFTHSTPPEKTQNACVSNPSNAFLAIS